MKHKHKLFYSFINWYDRHPVLTFILSLLPSLWFTFFTCFGEDFISNDAQGTITLCFKVINIISLVFYVLFPVIEKRTKIISQNKLKEEMEKNAKQIESTEYSAKILQSLLDSSTDIVRTKTKRYSSMLFQNRIDINSSINPKEQLSEILKEIERVLSTLFGLDRNDIDISILYAFYDNEQVCDKWRFLATKNINPNTDIDFILCNPHSSLRQILDGKTTSLFYPNKRTAAQNNQYVYFDDEDKNFIGSIFIKLIKVNRVGNGESLRATLCISTDKQQILDEKLDNFDDMSKVLTDIVLEPYIERIKLELTLYYLQHIFELQQIQVNKSQSHNNKQQNTKKNGNRSRSRKRQGTR